MDELFPIRDVYYRRGGSLLEGEDAKRRFRKKVQHEVRKLDVKWFWCRPSCPTSERAFKITKLEMVYQLVVLQQTRRMFHS